MSKLYIIILVPVIVAVLLVLFTGMDKMNTDEKGDEATDDGRKTYHWSPAISAPRKWPVEVFQADFILDKPEQEDTNVRVRSYFGPDFQCGGMGIEKSTAFDEDYRVVLPRYIEALDYQTKIVQKLFSQRESHKLNRS